MTKDRLKQMAANFRRKADKDFQNYQETGIGRYGNSYHRNEELADALDMAAAAADEHAEHLHMKYQLAVFAKQAQAIRQKKELDPAKADKLLRELEAYGCLQGLIRREGL